MGHIELLESRRFLAAGELDPTFGTGGIVIHDRLNGIGVGRDPNNYRGDFILPMTDGRFVTVSTNAVPDPEMTAVVPPYRALVARHLADGTLDPTFGDGGSGFFGAFDQEQWDGFTPVGAALQPDGGVVILGYVTREHALAGRVVRLTPQGSVDSSFDGSAITEDFFWMAHLLSQPGGKMILWTNVNGVGGKGVVRRFNADGSLDDTFGDHGAVDLGSKFDLINDLQVTKDGRIFVLSGHDPHLTPAVVLLPDGQFDPSIGQGDGRVNLYVGSSFIGHAILAADGGFYAGASNERVDYGQTIFKFTPQGTRDTSYGGGDAMANITEDLYASNIAWGRMSVQDDGKLIVSGWFPSALPSDDRLNVNDPIFARFNTDGTLDPTFGGDGVLRVQTALESDTRFAGAALTSDGDIIATATADGRLAVMRIDASPPLIQLEGDLLRITGTTGRDVVMLRSVIENGDAVEIKVNDQVRVVSTEDFNRISIAAGDGADYVDLRDVAVLETPTAVNVTIDGGSGNDVLVGSKGRDRITGGGDNDKIHGWDGDDWLSGNSQKDRIDGGLGDDLISGNGGRDFLDGSDGDDSLYGGDQPDVLSGGIGNDLLEGQGGHDRLIGGEGIDTMTGGGGNDTFYARDGEIDQIIAGIAATDRAQIDANDDVVGVEEFF